MWKYTDKGHFGFFGCSEVNSTWLITFELANQRARKALFTCVVYLQVNSLSEWIIVTYLHEFTNNEREISIPDNLRVMSALTFLLFKLNTLQTKVVKLWVSRSHGVMTVVWWIYTTIMTSRKLFRHNPVSRGTNQPIKKSEFSYNVPWTSFKVFYYVS